MIIIMIMMIAAPLMMMMFSDSGRSGTQYNKFLFVISWVIDLKLVSIPNHLQADSHTAAAAAWSPAFAFQLIMSTLYCTRHRYLGTLCCCRLYMYILRFSTSTTHLSASAASATRPSIFLWLSLLPLLKEPRTLLADDKRETLGCGSGENSCPSALSPRRRPPQIPNRTIKVDYV